jgi:hypothetical protein
MLLSNITIGKLRQLAARQATPAARAFLEEIARQMEADLDRLMPLMPGMGSHPLPPKVTRGDPGG